jgi:hypothetical protein
VTDALAGYRGALRAVAASLPPGTAVPVPRELLLELLADVVAGATSQADPTVEQLAARYGRARGTIRGWCEAGKFPGAYKLHGREWRIPAAAIEAFDAAQRPPEAPAGRTRPTRESMSDWRLVS